MLQVVVASLVLGLAHQLEVRTHKPWMSCDVLAGPAQPLEISLHIIGAAVEA